ncbi:MAG: ABC transporter ATP-binding protein [Sandaracinaceae bacterium]
MIDVDGLTYAYPGAAEPSVRGISFAVEEGEVFGFLGPSGAGKSTTQKVLIGLCRGYDGRAAVLGREVRDWGAELYEHVGVSFELPNHHQRLTAHENLSHFGGLYRGPIEDPGEVLSWVGLESAADQRVSDFSKGMKARLNVARSLLHRPKVLFLDEPTGGLDPVNADNIKRLVRRQQERGATVFLTTHDMVVADELCDRVAFLVDGRIAAEDRPDVLKKAHGRRAVRLSWSGPDGPEEQEFALDGLADDPAFLDALRDHEIEAIHSQETTLEKVFIDVTGQALRR